MEKNIKIGFPSMNLILMSLINISLVFRVVFHIDDGMGLFKFNNKHLIIIKYCDLFSYSWLRELSETSGFY